MTALLLGLMLGLAPPAHPMHTSATELNESGNGSVSIRIRIFEDDLTSALGTEPHRRPSDSTLVRYLRERFALTDRAGRQLPLEWISVESDGTVLLLRLQARVPAGLAGARVINGILCDRFHDQVNIVRASYAGRTATLLFTPGDGPKAIP